MTYKECIVGHSAPKQPVSQLNGLCFLCILSSACFLPRGKCVISRRTTYASFKQVLYLEKGHWLLIPRSNSGCGEQKNFGLTAYIIYKGTDKLRLKHTGWALLSSRIQDTTGTEVVPFTCSFTSLSLLKPWYSLLTHYSVIPKYNKIHNALVSFNVYSKYLHTQVLHKVLLITENKTVSRPM